MKLSDEFTDALAGRRYPIQKMRPEQRVARGQAKQRGAQFGVADDLANDPNRPGQFIVTGALNGQIRAGYDKSKFSPAKNYRLEGDQGSIPLTYMEEQDATGQWRNTDELCQDHYTPQRALPSGAIFASKRNSHNQSHWMNRWKGIQREGGNEQYNGYSFDLHPDYKIATINTPQEYINFLKDHLYASTYVHPGGDLNIIRDYDQLWEAYKANPKIWKDSATIDWENLNNKEKQGDKAVSGVQFTEPFMRWYENAKKFEVNFPEDNEMGDLYRWVKGVGQGPGADFADREGDHLVLVDPEAMTNIRFYNFDEQARPDRLDRTQPPAVRSKPRSTDSDRDTSEW